jgi:hypothetical protein
MITKTMSLPVAYEARSKHFRLIYISGKYRVDIEEEAKKIWRLGGIPIYQTESNYGISENGWIERNIEIIKHCDAIYSLVAQSNISAAELEYAMDSTIPRLYSMSEVKEFIGWN